MTTPLVFIQQTYAELKQVIWPDRTEIVRLTGIVVIISLAVGLYIGGIDLLLTKAFEFIIK